MPTSSTQYQVHTEARGPHWIAWITRGADAKPERSVVLVAATHALAHHRRSLERERRAVIAEAKLAEAQALAMQMQLQPHFFGNALNTVASLIYTQPEQAEETICALGELMRFLAEERASRGPSALRPSLST